MLYLYVICYAASQGDLYPLPILLSAARTEVWNVVLITQAEVHVPHNQGIILVQRKAILRLCDVLYFYYKKSAQPGKCLHLFRHTMQVACSYKYLMATSVASHKVVSKHIARIPVQGTKHMYKKAPQQDKPC